MTTESQAALQHYRDRTQTLLVQCETWCRALGLQVAQDQIHINEERHGRYTMPALKISTAQGKHLASIVPFGESILGAHGRVDLQGEYGKQEKIVYLSAGGPSITTRIQEGENGPMHEHTRLLYRGIEQEGWYWVSPAPIHRGYPLTLEIFKDLLSAVSGYEY